jgi:hypothetical protein
MSDGTVRPKAKRVKTGGGSRKGVPNKFTGDVKSMVLKALEMVGGEQYLAEQAILNPGPFMSLVGRMLPKAVEVSGKDGDAIKTNITVTFERPS